MISSPEFITQQNQPKNRQHSKTSRLNLLSTKGRVGRFTYFFYTLVLPILIFWVLAAVAGLLGKIGPTGEMMAYAVLFFAFLVSVFSIFQLAIKRCHDFNANGWLSLLILIPFTMLLLCLIPGNQGNNQYGEPPTSPSTLLKTGSLLLIATLVAMSTNWLLSALFG
jgi:uncharacterized membrane protein YhaH (DUF805 family)